MGGQSPTCHRISAIRMVFQSYSLFPHMTVAENVGFPLRMRGRLARDAAQKRIEEMLALVQLSHLRTATPGNFLAVSSNASPWRGRWYPDRGCFLWTSRSARSIRNYGKGNES